MKNVISTTLLAISVLTVSSNAKNIEKEIKTNETVQYKLTPDTMLGSITVQQSGQNQEDVRRLLEDVVIAVKNTDKNQYCAGGGYSSYPEDEWINGKRTRKGYQGSVTFSCKIKDITDYDRVANVVNLTLSKTYFQKTARISQSPLSWIIDENNIKSAKAEAEIELLSIAEKKAQIFSQKTKTQCYVKSIDYTNNGNDYRPYIKGVPAMMSAMSTQDSVSPIQQDVEQNFSANIIINCD